MLDNYYYGQPNPSEDSIKEGKAYGSSVMTVAFDLCTAPLVTEVILRHTDLFSINMPVLMQNAFSRQLFFDRLRGEVFGGHSMMF